MEISNELKGFINDFYESYYKKKLTIELKSETEVEKDLGVIGDDADDFLTSFVKRFALDHSEFDGRQYFGYEHESFDFFFPVLRFFFGNRKWLPMPKKKRKVLTLKMLDEAIVIKKLK